MRIGSAISSCRLWNTPEKRVRIVGLFVCALLIRFLYRASQKSAFGYYGGKRFPMSSSLSSFPPSFKTPGGSYKPNFDAIRKDTNLARFSLSRDLTPSPEPAEELGPFSPPLHAPVSASFGQPIESNWFSVPSGPSISPLPSAFDTARKKTTGMGQLLLPEDSND